MSDYSKQYTNRINNNSGWENYTSTATPLSAANLNKMDQAIQNIDNAVYNSVNSKANTTTVNGCINSISFNPTTGVFTIGFVNGTSTTINTALEKVTTNFVYDSTTQSLVLTYEDGTTERISLEEFITEYEFEDSDTIGFSVEDGKVTADILDGSITGEKLDPDYLSDCEDQVDTAKDYARQARSYATGDAVDDHGDPYRSGQGTDNSKYYYQLAHEAASSSGAAPFIGATDQTGGTQGLVPAPLIADKDKFLKGNGGWGTPTDTTYSAFTGATSQSAGTEGLVPQPTAGDQDKVLTGGGIWTSDTANLITTYTTEDDANTTAIITSAGGETAISTMESGAKHSRLFNKVSRTVLNTRKLINTVKRIWATVATSWASGETYAVGDVRLWTNGHTYVCKLAHTSSSSITPANATYWEDKTLGDMISSLNLNLANLSNRLPQGGLFTDLGGVKSTDLSTSYFTDVTIADISPYTLLRLAFSYYKSGLPEYAGATISVMQLRAASSEGITVTRSNTTDGFAVRYRNDTTIMVKYIGTQDSTKCLSVRAIL